jgi:putative PIG3 family NAD(P)H quinone oxidoreductase
MRAIVCERSGEPDVLRIDEVTRPSPGEHDLLVRNFAAGVNRADLLQRRGKYPPPPGESEILGLEFAGEVVAWGASVEGFAIGDRVFGLVAGGAYAEFVRVHKDLVAPIPDRFSYEAAAAIPEAFLTANEALSTHGMLAAGETVLIHAGASGVGSAAIQLARRQGGRVIATAGTPEKVDFCRALGADHAVYYRSEDFVEAVRDLTDGRGADLIVDFVGASYWRRNIASLALEGRLVLLGLLGGAEAPTPLQEILMKRLTIRGMTMRGLPIRSKIDIMRRFKQSVLPGLQDGELKPVIDQVFLLDDARRAHERMEGNRNSGKIVLRM